VNTKKADILQVRKYLNGELDAKAMHRLEREALDDPFLMDALDGFEAAPKDQQTNLTQLSARLQQRVEPQKGRVVSWPIWSIAASVLIVLTIGGLWLRKGPAVKEQNNKQTALKTDNTKVELKDTVAINNPAVQQAPLLTQSDKKNPAIVKPAEKSVYQQEISSADNKIAAALPAPTVPAKPRQQEDDDSKDVVSASEIVAANYTQNPKIKDNSDSLAILSKKAKARSSVPIETKLQGKVEGLTTETARDTRSYGYNSINGTIIAKNDGSPVIGAAIRIQGTNKSTVTDVNGYFSMPANGGKQTLDIASIGYLPRQISVKTGDSLKVELNPATSSLSEVVVADKSYDKPRVINAHPQGDMGAFKKYLQTNAIITDSDTEGTVQVLFIVNTDNSLSDIKIKKSLNPATDQKAIDLIKAGPVWVASSTGKAEQVTVKVKFRKK
jgi:hypothetical protein